MSASPNEQYVSPKPVTMPSGRPLRDLFEEVQRGLAERDRKWAEQDAYRRRVADRGLALSSHPLAREPMACGHDVYKPVYGYCPTAGRIAIVSFACVECGIERA